MPYVQRNPLESLWVEGWQCTQVLVVVHMYGENVTPG